MSVPMSFITRLLHSPDVIQFGARTAIRKNITSHIDYRFRNGQSAPPVQIDIKLVDACNLRCRMCPQWGENGYNFVRPTTSVKNTVPLETYKRLFDEVGPFKPWIFLWGGEPMLYPDILPLIAYIKSKGMPLSLVTNGTLLKGKIEQLVSLQPDVILFSIDGARETHDCIRGYKGAFDQTMAAVRAIREERDRLKQAKPFITFASVITAENQSTYDEVFEIGAEAGIDLMLAVCNWFQTAESGRKQTDILQRSMGITPWSWKGYLLDMDKIDPQEVRQTMRRIKSKKWPFHYKFFPVIDEDQLEPFFRNHEDSLGYTRCTAPWVMGEILPNGDVANCRDYPDVVAGNIKDKSFLEIWNKGKLVDFRNLLIENGGKLPVCHRCHGLLGC